MSILRSFFTLLLFQLLGESVRVISHLPLPGPVLGLALLTVWLFLRKSQLTPPLENTADGLLKVLGLLFVPAGVGIFAQQSLLRSAWLPVLVSLIVSTFLTLIVTAKVMHFLLRPSGKELR